MKTTDYPSDLTDAQFARLEPLLPKAKPGGRPREVNLHDVVNGILYVNRAGCQWRMLPADYPPWSTCYDYFRKWRNDGTWQKVNDALRGLVRQKAGKEPTPSAAAIDSQSAKAGGAGGEQGFDAAKRTHGRKRHVLVDTLGLVLAVLVTAAAVTSLISKSTPRLSFFENSTDAGPVAHLSASSSPVAAAATSVPAGSRSAFGGPAPRSPGFSPFAGLATVW
jgi:transposase